MSGLPAAPARLLLVDDDPQVCWIVSHVLDEAGYEVSTAETVRAALEAFEARPPDVVLLDLRLPDGDGMDLMQRMRDADPSVVVVMMTGHGTVESAVRAMKLGAFDYLMKPVQLDEVRLIVDKGLEARRLAAEVQTLRAAIRERAGHGGLVGRSPAMEQLRELIDRVARYDVNVLIRGETGTGKELVATALHLASARRNGPFIPLDCAALPETLMESELFGHERGAFTGATHRRMGRFELAHGGTLFLDEIGNLPLSTQVRLLRVLEDRAITRVGGRTPILIDVRIIAATHVNFEEAIGAGRFRDDLYHRLNEFTIRIPPLRERPEDVPDLAEHFRRRISAELVKPLDRVSPDALRALQAYQWPGNVRELRNVLKRAAVLSTGTIGLRDLPVELQAARAPETTSRADRDGRLRDVVHAVVERTERELIMRTLERTRWNRAQTARILGINYKTLQGKLRQYGLPERRVDATES
jgi:DNA-binding NtrC family response regulator